MFGNEAGIVTADLYFVHVPRQELTSIAQGGLEVDALERFALLHRARQAAGREDEVLAVDAANANGHIPSRAILNLNPQRRLEQIHAGGGILLRDALREPDVLLIYRSGKWDLPKGKPEGDEQIEECAFREVREEIGVWQLTDLGPAGSTLHGYPAGGRYLVKRTTWFFMSTPERTFTPEEREGIERVEWFPWSEAAERLGFPNLRNHLRALGTDAAREAIKAIR